MRILLTGGDGSCGWPCALDPEADPAEILYPADAGSIYHMTKAQAHESPHFEPPKV